MRNATMSPVQWALIVGASLALAPAAHAQQCVKGQHAVRLGDETVNLQDYTCNANGVSGGLRVTFFRVSEVVAGSLVMGGSVPLVDQLIAPVKFIENDVYNEVKSLFVNFGGSLVYDTPDAINWSINVMGVKLEPPAPPPGTMVKLWYLSRLFGSIDSDGLLLRAPSQVILNTDTWPQGFNMTFKCPREEKTFISCTRLWKYIGPADFNPIIQDVQSAYRRAETWLRRNSPERLQLVKEGMSDLTKNFALYRHLARRNLPNDFLYIMSSPATQQECGGGSNWTLEYSPKSLSLEFVVVENLTRQPLTIDKFLGGERADQNFRLASEVLAVGAKDVSSLPIAPIVLQSGAKAALALRMVFGDDSPRWIAKDHGPDGFWATPEETYQRIQSFQARRRFATTIGGFSAARRVIKTRESFRSPSSPQLNDYGYGPESCLSGLSVNGTNVMLDGQSANAIETISSDEGPFPYRSANALDLGINQITTTQREEGASCPILYSWREDAQSWIYHGKVLHLANGPERMMTDRIALPSVRTRFRLAEEEPEASFIDRVRLNLRLLDGRIIQLLPRQPIAPIIRANTAAEIDFDLPADLAPEHVVSSEIEIAGYYRRYSDMLSAPRDMSNWSRQDRALR